ncbi:cysteine-rich with EGF-like domain protein 2 isoform X1 [Mytilus edulis]|uniref:cysteine-rich with EGF-like domain protein 2 isoform X1 n=1 Tax=Mytilus edulis TaxID=6550 RepID=UPI0039EE872E
MTVNRLTVFSLFIISLIEYVALDKCSVCRGIIDNFDEGLKKTAKANFGGGNTRWEEKSLGSYATSETRLVEIVENLCSKDTKECHTMVEEYEDLVENFWFNQFQKKRDADFFQWLCIENVKVCCPKNTYGPSCSQCKGDKDRPCTSNGKCDGEGTREGTGKCNCDSGYQGDLCDECKDAFFEESKNDTHITCTACHMSCKSTCWEAGPKGCDECGKGWEQNEEEGCKDINECETDATCENGQYCSNTQGSYHCATCHKACDGCTLYGIDKCDKCAEGYTMEDNSCKDVDECLLEDICEDENKVCTNKDGGYDCKCKDGLIKENNTCIPKPKDIPKKKESKPHKKKFSSKDKKSLKKRNKYSQPSLLVHFAILGLYALCGLLVRGNVVIISVLTVFLGIYVYWFAI